MCLQTTRAQPPATTATLPTPFVEVDPKSITALRERGTGYPFVAVGVNYFDPLVGWAPRLWQKFDVERVRKHLDLIHGAGFNTIRVFLTYASFHNERGKLTPDGMDKLRTLLAMCRERSIRVILVGPDYWEGAPKWDVGDRFADDTTLDTDDMWWKAFAKQMRDDPAILAYDLLNEPTINWDTPAMHRAWKKYLESENTIGDQGFIKNASQSPTSSRTADDDLFAIPLPQPVTAVKPDPHLLDFQHLRETVADTWTRRKVAAIRSADPNHLITIGHIQWAAPILLPGVQNYAGFNLKENAKLLDFVTIHFYPLDWPKPCDDLTGNFVNAAYLQAVLFEADVGRPIMLGEFGWYGGGPIMENGKVTLPPQTPEQQLTWGKDLLGVTRGHVCGFLNWAFADAPDSTDLSRWSGCWTTDLKLKPWGEFFSQFARDQARKPDPPRLWPAYLQAATANIDEMKISPEAGNRARLQIRTGFAQPANH